MRKQVYIFILVAIPVFSFAQTLDRQQLRSYFVEAAHRRSALDSFINVIGQKSMTPYEECYLGICDGLEIQYIGSMWGKYKMLDKSRGHINAAIQKDPKDPEMRFIRFMLEHNIPAFLGMSTHIQGDLAYIFEHIDFLDDSPDMKKMAMEFIISSNRCSTDQRQLAERTISDLNKRMYALR
jgi:hypothetical protein